MRKYSSVLQSPAKGPRDLKPIIKPGKVVGVSTITDMVSSVLSWGQKPSHMEIAARFNGKHQYALSSAASKQDLYKITTSKSHQQENKVGASGFGNVAQDIEREIQPCVLTPEYDGNFAEGLRQGTGRLVYPNGDIYKGGFVKGQRHGTGIMLFKDGRFYKGQWANDHMRGKGLYKVSAEADSLIIEGNFEDGVCQAGQAKIQYPSGEIYEGRVNGQGQRDGPSGRHFYLNGDVYEGAWADGRRAGRGKLSFHAGG